VAALGGGQVDGEVLVIVVEWEEARAGLEACGGVLAAGR
jgi:hypothetical protein